MPKASRWDRTRLIARDVARVRDRNPMEVADDLGHRFWRLLLYDRRLRHLPVRMYRFSQSTSVSATLRTEYNFTCKD